MVVMIVLLDCLGNIIVTTPYFQKTINFLNLNSCMVY